MLKLERFAKPCIERTEKEEANNDGDVDEIIHVVVCW